MATPSTPGDAVVRRAALPEVLFAPDLAIVLCLSEPDADAGARAGRFGPEIYVGGRVAVLRQDFLEFLSLRASRRTVAEKEVLP